MHKKLIFLILVIFSLNNSFAQLDENIKAKLYFTEAEKTYNQGDFQSSLEYVNKAEKTLGFTVPRILALKIKVYFVLNNFKESKKLFDLYTNKYMSGASQELNDEVLGMFINIEEAYEREKELVAKREGEISRIKNFSKSEVLSFLENICSTNIREIDLGINNFHNKMISYDVNGINVKYPDTKIGSSPWRFCCGGGMHISMATNINAQIKFLRIEEIESIGDNALTIVGYFRINYKKIIRETISWGQSWLGERSGDTYLAFRKPKIYFKNEKSRDDFILGIKRLKQITN